MEKKVTGIVDNAEIANIQSKILTEIVNPILQVALAITFFLFIYGGVRFMMSRVSNPTEASKYSNHLFWGGLGLFILTSIWGIFNLIGSVTESNFWFLK